MPAEQLPLFPLSAVLFPRMSLPLHVFERRYRLMIQRCLQQDAVFGVVLIQAGEEVGGPAIPYSVGTAARITDVERFPDGRLKIRAVGQQRFRILRTSKDNPYLTGTVAWLPEVIGEHETVEQRVRQLRELYKVYLGMRQMLTREPVPVTDLGLPYDPAHLSYHLAGNLSLPRREQQRLLELPVAEQRLSDEWTILQREVAVLRFLVDKRRRGQGPPEFPDYIN